MTSAPANRDKGAEEGRALVIRSPQPPAAPEEPPERRNGRFRRAATMLSMPNAAIATVAITTMVALLSGGTASAGADGPSEDWAALGKSWMAETQTVSLELNPDILRPPETFRPLQNHSISPWTYNVSQDAWVLPAVSEARCLLRGCLDSNGAEDLRLRSRPILHQVLLLRRLKSSAGAPRQRQRFRLEPRLVAVGCTCVRDQQPWRPPAL